MVVLVEISYYPLTGDFSDPIKAFIKEISNKNISVEIGIMSSIISGEYEEVMRVLTDSMGALMKQYPSVFNLKISNSCPAK